MTTNPDHSDRAQRARAELERQYLARGAWDDIHALYRREGRLEELVLLLKRQIAAADDATKVRLWVRIATIYRDEIGKPRRAIWVFEHLLTMAGDDNVAVAEALIEPYEEAGEFEKLARVSEIQLAHTASPAERVERAWRLAVLYEYGLDDEERAFDSWLIAFAHESSSREIRAQLSRLARRTGRWQQLADAYEAACARAEPGDEAASALALELARMLRAELGRAGRAAEILLAALEAGNPDPAVREELEAIYREQGRSDELVEIYGEQLSRADDPAHRARILSRVSALSGAFEQALAEDPADEAAMARLERLAAVTGDWTSVSELYRALASRPLTVDQHVALRTRLGRLYEEQLGELDRAIATYRRVLDLSPGRAGVAAALERLCVTAERWADLDEYLRERDSRDRLIEILAAHLPVSAGGPIERFLAIARLCEDRLGDPDKAIEAAHAALSLDPNSLPALGALSRLYHRVGAYDRCLDMLDLELDTVFSDAERIEVLHRMAGLCRGDIGDPARAAEHLENALLIDDRRADCYRELAACYEEAGAWAALADCCGRHAAVEPDPGARVSLWQKAADVCRDRLDDAEGAILALESMLEAARELGEGARGSDALRVRGYLALSALYEQTGDAGDADAGDADAGEAGIATDDDRAGIEKAGIEKAIWAADQALSLDPGSLDAIAALSRLHRAAGDYERLRDVLDLELHAARGDRERIAVLERLADVCEVHLDDLDRAAEYVESILAIDSARVEGYERLASYYERAEAWPALAECYQRHVAATDDPGVRVELRRALAWLYEDRLRDLARAAETCAELLEESPGDSVALAALERLASAGLAADRQASAGSDGDERGHGSRASTSDITAAPADEPSGEGTT